MKVSAAISAASYLHLRQNRANRTGLPRTSYVAHTLGNGLRVLRWGATSEAILVSVVLHDTAEDCLGRILDAFVPGDWTGLNETAQGELARRTRAKLLG